MHCSNANCARGHTRVCYNNAKLYVQDEVPDKPDVSTIMRIDYKVCTVRRSIVRIVRKYALSRTQFLPTPAEAAPNRIT